MKKLLQTSFVEQLRGREYSIEYFISHYDSSNQELIKECYEQLDLGELEVLQLLVAAWKLDLKFYNFIDRLRAYNCLNTINQLADRRIWYLVASKKENRVNREWRCPFQLDEKQRRVLEEIYLKKKQNISETKAQEKNNLEDSC